MFATPVENIVECNARFAPIGKEPLAAIPTLGLPAQAMRSCLEFQE